MARRGGRVRGSLLATRLWRRSCGSRRLRAGDPRDLVWAAAKLNGVANVLSEDFQDGGLIEGVRFLDPFAPGFGAERI